MWLGAATMRGAISRIAPEAHFITRPRFSDLAYAGPKKLSRLPRRSAIVAFSVEDVYGVADTIRSQRGGAAVVLGALSPRTRNAQVALYQSGEVDFLIATDAIGMGINMDVDHVAFSARDKFDGVTVRPLRPEEIGQIAGRAGRYMNDGTFGVTGDADPFDAELVEQIENHRYDPVKVLQWRNSALDFSSLEALLYSLDALPPARGLVKARPASDHFTLQTLARDEEIRALTPAPAALRLLWQACQLPDFRKLTPDEHTRLVGQIFRHLISEEGVLPGGLAGAADRAARRRGGRRRHAVGPPRANPHLDLCRAPAGLDTRSRALAGNHARGRGPAVGRAPRAADAALHRPAHGAPDAALARRGTSGALARRVRAPWRLAPSMSESSTGFISRPIRARREFTAAPCGRRRFGGSTARSSRAPAR